MDLRSIGLIDLVVLGVVVLAVVAALRGRRGLLGAVGSAVGALVVCWLAMVAVTAWGPAPVSTAVRDGSFVDRFPVPDRALDQLRDLDGGNPSPGSATG